MATRLSINSSPNTNALLENGLNLINASTYEDYLIKFNFPAKTVEIQIEWADVSASTAQVQIWDKNDPSMGYYQYIVTDASVNVPVNLTAGAGNEKILLWSFTGTDVMLRVVKGNASAGTVKLAYGARPI